MLLERQGLSGAEIERAGTKRKGNWGTDQQMRAGALRRESVGDRLI